MNVRFALFGKVKIKVKAKRCGHIVHITEHVLIPAAKIHILSNPPNKNGLFSQKNGVFSVFFITNTVFAEPVSRLNPKRSLGN